MENNEIKEDLAPSFVHLHLHSEYSLLDGAIRLKDLFKRAKELKVPAVALTDHGNMFGAIDFYVNAKKAGIKPIIGCEIYYTSGSRFQKVQEDDNKYFHLVLLCKDNTGYQNLCKLISKSWLEGFYYKPRADYELLRQYSEGLIALSACLAGEGAHHFINGQDTKAYEALDRLHAIFKDDFYIEIQENGMVEQREANKKLIQYARERSVPLVATNDCHYLNRTDAFAHEVLLCIQTGKTLSDEKRMKMSSDEFYYKSPEEMRAQFADVPEACDNTLKIAEKCNLSLKWTDDKGKQIYHLPKFEIDTGESEDDFFRRLSKEGLVKRFDGPHFKLLRFQDNWESDVKPKYEQRLHEEIEMIIKMGFPGYFLIVSDFITWAKNNGVPVGPGRGSGAGSLVAYALQITNIDPIPYNLLFERFINPERISMPDFDVDFCQTGRGKVIEYVINKYGSEKVSQIITFGKLLAKGVIRDVSRVFDLSYDEGDVLAKLVPEELGITLEDAIAKEPKLQEMIESDGKVRRVFEIADRLEGLNRNAGIHAAGVIITNEPLENHCPLSRGKEGEMVCQYDKKYSELIGLVKFDFLGLKTLTVIDLASNFIKRDLDPTFDIEDIDIHDKDVFEFIASGETIGVFQIESSGMIELCKNIKPESIDDITAINALYRPGPLSAKVDKTFANIKHGRAVEVYPYEDLRPVLKDTYGLIIYQEQVMNIARIVAGYSLGQADMLRRAMGKKDAAEMERHKDIFLKGASERGYDAKIALDLYNTMAGFAEYGFNKSHAVAYSYITYQTAYLKYYYPAQFFAGLLSTELSNKDKVTSYINELKKFDIKVLPPDVNESLWLFNVVEGNIRFGMGAIRNVGESATAALVREREANGPFKGILDFCQRVSFKDINSKLLEALIKVGGFDNCEKMNRKTMLENLEAIITFGKKKQEEKELGQGSLFDVFGSEGENSVQFEVQKTEEFTEKEKLSLEKEYLGIFVSGHPLDRYASLVEKLTSMPIQKVFELESQLAKVKPGAFVREGDEYAKRDLVVAGMITTSKIILTKKNRKMAFFTLEDFSGKIECIVFPDTFDKFQELIQEDEPVLIDGFTKLDNGDRKIFPNKISKLSDQAQERVTSVRIKINADSVDLDDLEKCKQILLSYRGNVPCHMIFDVTPGRARMNLSSEYSVNATPQLASKINEIFHTNSVEFYVDNKLEDLQG